MAKNKKLYINKWGDIEHKKIPFGNIRDTDVMVALISNIKNNPETDTTEIAQRTGLPQEDLDTFLQECLESGMVVERHE